MFAKVFRQIFESSIAEDYTVRHVFMDLIVLADLDGVIDKTHEAIARLTNVPLEHVQRAIHELESPDPKSRSDTEEGRRLMRLDDHRDWGWQIVNYEVYRNIRDEEARRAYFRERKRIERERKRLSNGVLDSQTKSNESTKEDTSVSSSFSLSLEEGSREEPKRDKTRPLTAKEVEEHVVGYLELTQNDAFWLWDHWVGNGFTVNNKRMKNWKGVASAWARMPPERNPYPSLGSVRK
jgi:hypothetical protein